MKEILSILVIIIFPAMVFIRRQAVERIRFEVESIG